MSTYETHRRARARAQRLAKLASKRMSGVTLVELMVALALGLAIVAAVGYIYVAGNQGYRVQDEQSRMQEDARFIIETMSRDIKMAGLFGCPPVVSVPKSEQTTLELLASQPVMRTNTNWLMLDGSDDQPIDRFVDPSWALRVVSSNDAAIVSPSLDSPFPAAVRSTTRLPTTDVLVILRGSDDAQSVQTSTNNSLTLSARIPGTGSNPTMVVSNCRTAKIFKPTVTASGTGVLLSIVNGLNSNVNAAAGIADFNTAFEPGSTVTLFSPVVYYISRAPTTGPLPIAQRVPQLRRLSIIDDSPTDRGAWSDNEGNVVASGVESMTYQFQVRDSAAGTLVERSLTGQAGEPPAIQPPDWSNVVGVRVQFTLVSANTNNTATQQSTRTVGGVAVTDSRLVQRYDFTVGVRGRQGTHAF
jgi:type IV pilus assembly protein PilW